MYSRYSMFVNKLDRYDVTIIRMQYQCKTSTFIQVTCTGIKIVNDYL